MFDPRVDLVFGVSTFGVSASDEVVDDVLDRDARCDLGDAAIERNWRGGSLVAIFNPFSFLISSSNFFCSGTSRTTSVFWTLFFHYFQNLTNGEKPFPGKLSPFFLFKSRNLEVVKPKEVTFGTGSVMKIAFLSSLSDDDGCDRDAGVDDYYPGI